MPRKITEQETELSLLKAEHPHYADEQINNMPELQGLMETQKEKEKSELESLKELFDKKNIEAKTEATIGMVILLNQKRTIARLLNWHSLNDCLDDFMVLMVSHRRQGRSEFVDGFKAGREGQIKSQSGFFSRIGEAFK
jgi:hypothetical protein